jgi:hypothetical protein
MNPQDLDFEPIARAFKAAALEKAQTLAQTSCRPRYQVRDAAQTLLFEGTAPWPIEAHHRCLRELAFQLVENYVNEVDPERYCLSVRVAYCAARGYGRHAFGVWAHLDNGDQKLFTVTLEP